MDIRMHSQGFPLTPAIETHGHKRFSKALRAADYSVVHVDVYLKDINGPTKRGEDKSVLVRVRLAEHPAIAIEVARTNLYAAMNVAARRLRRAVRRVIEKRQRFHRRRLRELHEASHGIVAA